ncbi:MAG: hypothetical protein JW709_01540 [Sedimentisphaerales bacterium]|nr:hypothetical protein [Sedimentisphaerales bacterium]
MTGLDVLVLVIYLVGLLVIGGVFVRRIKNSQDMFAAAGQAPWWMSALSGYMTIFSAGTFVVWGGIAYKQGMVSVSILVCAGGISTLAAGYLLAGRWRRLGITTPAEYINLRFGASTVQTFTWLNLLCGCMSMAIALFSLSKMLTALISISPDYTLSFLADPATGHLSINGAIIIGGVVVVAYTMAGGLWAVLTTDVIQCVVLSLVVLMVVPLSLARVGGISGFVEHEQLPKGFFLPTAGEFTWVYLALWTVANFFTHGGQWAFIQRFICVPSEKDARKTAYFMGGLYFVSTIFWMLPAMIYRIMQPGVDSGEAYIKVCQDVLPAGMLGMTLAAMFSATASMVSSLLNVFAGAFTRDIYRPLFKPNAGEKHLVVVGRITTLVYGAAVLTLATLIPRLGGAEEVVFMLVTLVIVPTVVPSVWGLFSRKITARHLWISIAITAGISGTMKVFIDPMKGVDAWSLVVRLQERIGGSGPVVWLQDHTRLWEVVVGTFIPLILIALMELRLRDVSAGWTRLQAFAQAHQVKAQTKKPVVSTLPAMIVAGTMWILALIVGALGYSDKSHKLILFIFTGLLVIAGLVIVGICQHHRRMTASSQPHA